MWSQEVPEKYPLEEPRGVYVNHAAPLRHRHGTVVALVFADNLAVDKHRDQGTLWEPSHVGLSGWTFDVQMKLMNWKKYKTFRVGPSGYFRKGFLIPDFLPGGEFPNWKSQPAFFFFQQAITKDLDILWSPK